MKAVLLCMALMFQGGIPASSDLKYTVRLDRTAVWVGDQFHYLVIVDYPSEYEFVLENLTKETVNMDPFQVVDVRTSSVVRSDNVRRLFVDLTLVNFTISRVTMEIPQLTLYYFRKDNRTVSADQATAESLTIPATTIETRSTLPENPVNIRDALTVNSWDRSRRVIPVIGWISFAILFVGSGWELVSFARRWRARKGPDRRNAMKAVRERWSRAVPSEFSDAKACSAFLDQSYQNLKEYVGHYLETPVMGLTAEEMREEMKRLGAGTDLTQRVVKVMETCETLRYTPNGASAHSDVARAVAESMREILNSTK